MLRLILMRHAKSSWDDPNQRDFDRPLNKRGNKNAGEMGEFMKKQGIKVEMALCSPAARTKETLELISRELPIKAFRYESGIYEASAGELLNIIQQQKNLSPILFIGHNPSISGIAAYLCNQTIEPFPTAAVLCMDFDLKDWKDIQPDSGQIILKKFPKEL